MKNGKWLKTWQGADTKMGFLIFTQIDEKQLLLELLYFYTVCQYNSCLCYEHINNDNKYQSFTQRTENPYGLRERSLPTLVLEYSRYRYQAVVAVADVALHQRPLERSSKKKPWSALLPPGNPAQPLLLSASLPLAQILVPLTFNFPPATEVPPRQVTNVVHSASVDTCQPAGARPLGSATAYQLYNLP